MSGVNENVRLKVEDDLTAALSGGLQRNALDFVAFLKANGMTPDSVGVICTYPVDGVVGWTIFMGGYDSVLLRSEYQDFPIDEELKEVAWAHVKPCFDFTKNLRESNGGCGCGLQPGRSITIFGREFHNVCTAVLYFRNPEGKTLELAKRLAVVWKQSNADAARKNKPSVLKEGEWPSVGGDGACMGRPLGKAYAESLKVRFYITPRRGDVHAAVGFSGGGFVPATWQHIPISLRSVVPRFDACKGPNEGWHLVKPLKYLTNLTYFVEMSINISDNTYSATACLVDASDEKSEPRCIAKDFPFRAGPDIPAITALDTIYLGQEDGDGPAFIVRDFKIVGGE